MKKSLCIAICFAVVLTACAVGFSAFAGTDSLSVVSAPNKLYYLDVSDTVDVTGTKLKVKIDGAEQVVELTKNIERTGSVADADVTTATETTTVAETTTAETTTQAGESTTAAETTTATETTTAVETTTEPATTVTVRESDIKVYYNQPLVAGENEVVFKYADKTASCKIYVDADPVQKIKVTKAPDKTEYFFYYDDGKPIDCSGLEVTVTYKDFGDGAQEFVYKYDEVESLDFMGHRFNIRLAYNHQEGKNPVIVTYLGKEANFDIYYKKIYPGDVNNDGAVNAKDLVRLQRIVLGEKLSYNPITTDLNEDGKINTKDITELRKALTIADKSGEFEWVFDAKLLSYMVSADGYFYTADDPWQRNFGFNEVYDYATPYTFMYYDTFRVFFDYGEYEEGELDGVPAGTPKQWMIQPWKGQYGMVLYGAELGVYTKPDTRTTPHYDCANDDDRLPMAMTVYKDKKLSFSMPDKNAQPDKKYWWITGFKPGALDNYTDMSKPHSQLMIEFKIDFPSNEMANKFAAGLEERGFTKTGFIDTVNFRKVDVYTINGNRVEFLWRDVVGTPGQTNVPNSVPVAN